MSYGWAKDADTHAQQQYMHGDSIVASVREVDQIVIEIKFTTEDQIPDNQTLILQRGQYEALCRHIRGLSPSTSAVRDVPEEG